MKLQLDEAAQALVKKQPQMVISTELAIQITHLLNPAAMLATPVGILVDVQQALQASMPPADVESPGKQSTS